MNGMLERLTGRPTLPDLFGWVETGLPVVHTRRGRTVSASRSG